MQTPTSKPKQRRPTKAKLRKTEKETILYTPDEFKTSADSEMPKLLFITKAALTADEMLSLLCKLNFISSPGSIDEAAIKKPPEVRKTRKVVESEKLAGKTTPKLRRKKVQPLPPPPPEPNHYLLGRNQLKPSEPQLSFCYEVATYALKLVQLKVCYRLHVFFL